MNRLLIAPLLVVVALAACAETRPHSRSGGGQKIAIRQISNKSQQFGLESTFSAALLDEFLRDGANKRTDFSCLICRVA